MTRSFSESLSPKKNMIYKTPEKFLLRLILGFWEWMTYCDNLPENSSQPNRLISKLQCLEKNIVTVTVLTLITNGCHTNRMIQCLYYGRITVLFVFHVYQVVKTAFLSGFRESWLAEVRIKKAILAIQQLETQSIWRTRLLLNDQGKRYFYSSYKL